MARTFRTLPLVAAALAAAGSESMAPTPAKVPPATDPYTHLVDRVIPAYGVVDLDSNTRTGAFLARCRAFADAIEADEMAGKLHAAAPTPAGDKRDKKKGEPVAPASTAEAGQLHALADELVQLEQSLKPSDGDAQLPVLEQWQLDEAYADIERAAVALHLGLDDATFDGLVQKHQSWLQSYQASVGPAREAKIKELMKTKKLSRSEAEEELTKEHWEAPYTTGGNAAAPAAPAKAEAPAPAEQPAAPKPAPAPVATPKPAPAPKPVPAPVAAEPAPELPAPAPETQPAPEPAPGAAAPDTMNAPETAPVPAPETPAPEASAPAPETQPAPEPAPAETPKADEPKAAEPKPEAPKKTDEKPGDLPDL